MGSTRMRSLDRIEMKDQIQQGMERCFAGLTDDERCERIRPRLENADDPVARMWRAIAGAEATVR